MLSGYDIVCVSWVAWEHVPLVMHQMMRRLATCNRVVFVDPPVSRATLVPHPSQWPDIQRAIALHQAGPERVADGLWVYRPPPIPLPFGHSDVVDRISRRRLMRALRQTIGRLDFSRPIVWAYDALAFEPDGSLGERLVCYDCNDDVSSFARFAHKRAGLQRRERWFCQRADLVLTTSRALYRKQAAINPKAYYFPSGIDLEAYRGARASTAPLPIDIARLPAPRIGYVGSMTNYRIAWSWLHHVAARHPTWSFVLIGPQRERPPASIRKLANVHFLGPRSPEQLPAYIKGFDVGIIPYQGEAFLQSCQPTKTFEYLAMGKPVVATAMPELEALGALVGMASDRHQFDAQIEAGLVVSQAPELVQQRLAAAEAVTWAARVEGTSDLILARLAGSR